MITFMSRLRNILKKINGFLYPPADIEIENIQQLDAKANDLFFGKMENYTAAGYVKGPCGDSMEFYLIIENDIIKEVSYYTDGCESTRVAGYAIARRAKGKKVIDALCISPGEIIKTGECLEAEGSHCAILAASTLHQAIADYLLHPPAS